MRKIQDLEAAIMATQSSDEVIGLLNIWQGRITDFWRTAARTTPHWSESLALGVAHDSGAAPEAAANPALPPAIGSTMGMWFANRLFGDTSNEVHVPAYYALCKLAERNMIDGESGAVAIVLNRLSRKGAGADWTAAELKAIDILQKVQNLSPGSLHLIIEKLRIRPQTLSTPRIRAKFESQLREYDKPGAKVGR